MEAMRRGAVGVAYLSGLLRGWLFSFTCRFIGLDEQGYLPAGQINSMFAPGSITARLN
jgi:hypothetical protein